MTPSEKAAKEIEVIGWMSRQGYDRRASKDIAPIIVNYMEEVVKNLSSNLPVIGSAICDAIDANQVQKVDRHVGMFLEIEKTIKLHLL